MRSMMLAAALALTSLVAQPVADACGGYDIGPRAPVLYLVSAHDPGHTFVLLNQSVDATQYTWRVLDPMSFDRTAIAPAPAFTAPVELTLLGPSGSKQVSTRTQVLVDDKTAADRKPMAAAQVPSGGEFRVAALGALTGLQWRDLEQVERTTATRRWAKQLGVESAYMSRQGDVETLSFFNVQRNAFDTNVRVGRQPLGTFTGSPLGMVTADGIRYLVLVEAGGVTTISLGAAAKAR